MVEGDRAAFVENNTTHSVPRLLAELERQGLSPEQVEYAIITHVHLDHAGGSSALLEHCPNATLLAHPKAARHVIQPERLIQSSRAVYGDETYEKLYGEIKPVDESRVRTMEDGAELEFGSRTLRFVHTRGHADHHFCIYDSGSEGIFTGDSFGIGYRKLQSQVPFLYPSSTPTQFHPEEARKSVARIRGTGAKRAFLTHFGAFEDMESGERQMLAGLDHFERLLSDAVAADAEGEELQRFCEEGMRGYFQDKLVAHGLVLSEAEWKLLNLDVGINAMGIAHAAGRLRKKGAS